MFNEFFIIFSIVIIHELGHILSAKIYGWKLDKISIYPYGGCVKFGEDLNKSLYQEMIIMLSGPLTQILYFLFIIFLYNKGIITSRSYLLFKSYHYTLLTFNLLPIYPLDGGKLVNILTNLSLPYKKGNLIVIISSVVITVVLLTLSHNVNFFFMGILLIFECLLYLKKQNFLYNKLLLERYLKNITHEKLKIIKNRNNMYQNKRHVIKDDKKYVTEKEYLNKRFGR